MWNLKLCFRWFFFQTKGGVDCGHLTRRILQFIMTSQVASTYNHNWVGLRDKLAFKNTNMKKPVFCMAFKCFFIDLDFMIILLNNIHFYWTRYTHITIYCSIYFVWLFVSCEYKQMLKKPRYRLCSIIFNWVFTKNDRFYKKY